MPERKYIVRGQRINPIKLDVAKRLRRNMTPAERQLWGRLRANRLDGFHFRRQQIIDGFIVDFFCYAANLVVEVDGPVHKGQAEYDAEREGVLAARGLRVLRVRNEEVMQDLESVLERIRAACRRDLTPQPPSLQGKGETSDVVTPPLPGEGPGEGSSGGTGQP